MPINAENIKYFEVEGGFVFHIPNIAEQEKINKIWEDHTFDLQLTPKEIQKQAPDLFTILIAYSRCNVTLDKAPTKFSLENLTDQEVIQLGIKIAKAEQAFLDQLDSNCIEKAVSDIFTRTWWYRDKYKLVITDPKYTNLTLYDINREWFSSEAKTLLSSYQRESNYQSYTIDELEERLVAELKGVLSKSDQQAQKDLEDFQRKYVQRMQEEEKAQERAQKEAEMFSHTNIKEEVDWKDAYFDDSLWVDYKGDEEDGN